MHRNQVSMSSLRRLFMLQVFAILICAPAAWSQQFGTNVTGNATTCGGTNKYSQDGDLSSSDKAISVCDDPANPAGAAAASTASLLKGTRGVVGVGGPASASAGFITYDTVALIPPPNFKGTSVKFTISDSYKVEIRNEGGSGKVKICWQYEYGPGGRTEEHSCATTVTGNGGSFTRSMTLASKSQSFVLKIAKVGSADAESSSKTGWTAIYSTPGMPSLGLPKGWNCAWAGTLLPCHL
jgi:hypothetical protein